MYRYVLQSDEFTQAIKAGLSSVEAKKYQDYVYKRKAAIARNGAPSYKDTQRERVYAAEGIMERDYLLLEENKFESLEEAQAYADMVLNSTLWKKICPKSHDNRNLKTIPIKYLRRDCKYTGVYYDRWGGDPAMIKLQRKHGLNKLILLHELAHAATTSNRHDTEFRQAHVKLISKFISKEAGAKLKACFKEAGLKMTINKTIKTPEQWIKYYRIMANARSKV